MTKKLVISVPDELLTAVDAERKVSNISRSRLFGLAAVTYLEQHGRARASDRYVRSYAEHPETDEELEATEAFLRATWAADDP